MKEICKLEKGENTRETRYDVPYYCGDYGCDDYKYIDPEHTIKANCN